MEEYKDKHPSYGMLQFCRTSSSAATSLFGSSIQHRDTIRMYLREGEVERHLNSDNYMGTRQIVEIEMSYSQFAEVITSMNQGTGVPVTIKHLQGKGAIEGCPFINKKDQFEDEFKEHLNESNQKADELIYAVVKLFDEKKSFNKSDKESIMNMLRCLKNEIGSNTEFTYKMFNEQMDKTVLEAKGEVEAFVQNKINSIANMALVEHKDELVKLKNPIEL